MFGSPSGDRGRYATKGYRILVLMVPKTVMDRKSRQWVRFKCRLRRQWGMEWIIIALLCINLLFLLWQTRILGLAIQNGIETLDYRLAEAITTAFEQLPGELAEGIEPPNMIQQAIAQLLMQKLNPTLEVKEISRAPDGKFAPDTSS